MLKKKKVLVAGIVILAMAMTFVAGCSGEVTEEELTKLTVSEVTHSVFYAPQYTAISQGFFEEEGLDVELINGGGADKVMTAVLSGQVEIGFSGSESTVYVYNEGRDDYAVTFAQLTNRDGSFLLGREEDPDFTWDKLVGKSVVGGRAGGMPNMTLEHVLRQNGIDPKTDVDIDTSVQFDSMAAAFQSGESEYEYVTLFEPVASAMEKQGVGYVVASIGEASGDVAYTAYFANKSYMEENPEIIQSFTNAIHKGLAWAESASYEEIADAIHEFFPDMEYEDLVKVVQRYKDQDSWVKNPIMTEESFEHMQDIIEAAGVINKRAPYEDIVTTDFAERAVEEVQ